MPGIFDEVRAGLPQIQEVAKRYGLEFDRRGKARCCFHRPDRNASMSFKDDRFKCFACGEGGDAIKLVQCLTGAKRPLDAARMLNHDFGLGLDLDAPVSPSAAAEAERNRQRLAELEEKKWCEFRALARVVRQLEAWKATFAPFSPGGNMDARYVAACKALDYCEYRLEVVVFEEGSG